MTKIVGNKLTHAISEITRKWREMGFCQRITNPTQIFNLITCNLIPPQTDFAKYAHQYLLTMNLSSPYLLVERSRLFRMKKKPNMGGTAIQLFFSFPIKYQLYLYFTFS